MAALVRAATALAIRKSGLGKSPGSAWRSAAAPLLQLAGAGRLILVGALAIALTASPAFAASNRVRITKLTDAAFGSIANLGINATRTQNVCLFSDTNTHGYRITAVGTGPGGAFRLTSGGNTLAFQVQWNSSSGQSSGTQLTPNVPLTGLISSATQQACNSGPPTSASLIILLQSSALSSATAGAYSGTLTLIAGPE